MGDLYGDDYGSYLLSEDLRGIYKCRVPIYEDGGKFSYDCMTLALSEFVVPHLEIMDS